MYKLSSIIVLILLFIGSYAQQSPHGDSFKIDCASCHTTEGWKVSLSNLNFDHNSTRFKLTGQHKEVNCKACHKTLIFEEAKSECFQCHTDLHQNTVGTDCARCHTTKSWIVTNTITMHQLSRFPLQGNHAVADCSSCHPSASGFKYEPLSVECVSCHRTDYLATTAPNHVRLGYSTNCNDCHGVQSGSWNASTFEHGFFPLTGGHSISCTDCHTGGTFQKISNECVSCHLSNYNSTSNPNHQQSGFSTSCADCHTTNQGWIPASFKQHDAAYFPIYSGSHNGQWNKCNECHTTNSYSTFSCTTCHAHSQSNTNNEHKEVSGYTYNSGSCFSCHPQGNKLGAFNHSTTSFPLTGAHTTVDCALCHTNGYAGTSTECSSCHQTNFNTAQTPNHSKAGIPADCKSCHTTTAWQPSSFKHSTTGFELTGAHASIVQCSSCHVGNTTTASSQCVSCHQVQYNNAKDHVASKFPIDCTICHNSTNWLQSTFNHSTTAFPLTGAHTTVDCALCHTNGYAGTSTECSSCHQTNFNTAQTPNHSKAGLSSDCKNCHTTTAWQPSSFKHGTTGFELTGAHAAIVQCSSCHVGNTTTASSQCVSCHQVQYNNAKDHVASKFPTDCTICHNSTNWLQSTFNHSTTAFPLTGAHTTVDCALCHTNGYAGTSTECSSCHQTNFNTAQTPNHSKAGIPADCKSCHTTTAWQPSSFKHGTTGFELTGAHAAIVQCSSCHVGNTTTASSQCVSCHQVQYNNAKDHVASKFPIDCTICHNSTNWLQSTFNHSTTAFPLTGAHTTVDCALCHTNGYAGTSTECSSCHQTNFNTAQTPNHSKAGIPADCKSCHTTTAWQPSSFKHGTTGFELTGAHAAIVQCSSCHVGNTTTASSQCVSCHQVQYNNAKDHVASKFPTDCTICHNSTNWLQSTFNHSTTTFPLTGAHTTVDCALCHTNGYAGTSTECSSCHTSGFNQATNPNHKTLGLALTCKDCHTTNPNWQPASFPIHGNYYVLSGAHATISNDCAACHKGVYTNTPATCYACHTADYNKTTNPSHAAAQFSTDCNSCHTNKAWVPSTFNHSNYFPITSGRHNLNCATCHTTSTNYSVFTCVTSSCHTNAHNQNQGSTGCYRCHPTGRAD